MINKKFKIFVIHHSHTDIGYTERQERVELFHVDFIRQALAILEDVYSGKKSEYSNFKWTCESFWCVEKFLEEATEKEKALFEHAVRQGDITICASYLNLTELADEDILDKKIKAAVNYGNNLGIEVKTAMSCDINGYAWGYAKLLQQNGVDNLIASIHTHHGMFPLFKKQHPFYWETSEGEKILVWNSEYYHMGNELGIAEGYETTYMITDEFGGRPDASGRLDRAYKRIFRYCARLEEEGYEYNFFPALVSGMITDNSPPSEKICEFIKKWNDVYGEQVEMEFVTLDEFFQYTREHIETIPTYSGDFTDWWADGVGSTAETVKTYKDAQRKYQLCKLLDAENILGSKKLVEEAENNLMMFAEHTWGYSSSISEPCNTMVNELYLRKAAYAVNGNVAISKNLDRILVRKGDALLYTRHQDFYYKIVNPFDFTVKDIARLYVGYWDNLGYEVMVEDVATGTIYPHQVAHASRGIEVNVLIELQPKQEITVRLIPDTKQSYGTLYNHAYVGAERVRDIDTETNTKDYTTVFGIDTPFFTIKYDRRRGIYSWIDKVNNKELVNAGSEHQPFTPIYQRTPILTNLYEERRLMGRNRKGLHANTYVGEISNIKVVADGELFSKVELHYTLQGTTSNVVTLTAYKHIAKVDVTYAVIKDNTIEPENLYLPLNFNLGETSECFIDKTGCIIRPGIDQLPGTCMEYYLLQSGVVYKNEESAVCIAIKDAPLIFTGGIEHHMIKLCTGDPEDNKREVYSWLMNNFWETNFRANLGGAVEFRYSVTTEENRDVAELFKKQQVHNTGLIAYITKREE